VLDTLQIGDPDPQEQEVPVDLDKEAVVLDCLRPDWDVLIKIQSALQSLPRVRLQYVAKHQEKKRPYQALNRSNSCPLRPELTYSSPTAPSLADIRRYYFTKLLQSPYWNIFVRRTLGTSQAYTQSTGKRKRQQSTKPPFHILTSLNFYIAFSQPLPPIFATHNQPTEQHRLDSIISGEILRRLESASEPL
jgi:hypothetical protein